MPAELFKSATSNIVFMAYSVCLNLAILYAVHFEIQGRVLYTSQTSPITTNIIGNLATSLLGFANVSVSVTAVLNARDGWNMFTEKIKDFDACLKDLKVNREEANKTKIAAIFLIHIFSFYLIFVEIYIWKSTETPSLMHFNIWDNILRYRLNIFVASIYFFIQELYNRIKNMNYTLRHISKYFCTKRKGKQHSIARATLYICQIPDATNHVSKAYGITIEIVKMFNKSYGWLLLVLLMNYLLVCIIAFNLGLNIKITIYNNWIHLLWLSTLILSAAVSYTIDYIIPNIYVLKRQKVLISVNYS